MMSREQQQEEKSRRLLFKRHRLLLCGSNDSTDRWNNKEPFLGSIYDAFLRLWCILNSVEDQMSHFQHLYWNTKLMLS